MAQLTDNVMAEVKAEIESQLKTEGKSKQTN